MVCSKAATTASRCSGTGYAVATTMTLMMDLSGGVLLSIMRHAQSPCAGSHHTVARTAGPVLTRVMELGLHVADFTWPGGAAELASTLTRIATTAEDVGIARLTVMDHQI